MIPLPRPRLRTASRAAVAALAGALLLGGCTGDGGSDASSSPSASSDAQAQAAATVETLIASGIDQAEAGDTQAARTTFANVLTIDPGNKFAYYNLAILDTQDGDTESALANYGRALDTDPQYTPALFNKAILVEATDPEQAISIYENIVTIDPKASTAFLRLSFLLAAKGETDRADEARQSALAIDPTLSSVEAPTPGPTDAGTGE